MAPPLFREEPRRMPPRQVREGRRGYTKIFIGLLKRPHTGHTLGSLQYQAVLLGWRSL